jgi:hypothetical protein
MKQTILQWLQDPNKISKYNLNNIRHDASRYFRNEKRECLKDKINEFLMNSVDRNTRDLFRGINAVVWTGLVP